VLEQTVQINLINVNVSYRIFGVAKDEIPEFKTASTNKNLFFVSVLNWIFCQKTPPLRRFRNMAGFHRRPLLIQFC